MSACHHIGMPFLSWEGIVALLTALGLGGVLTNLVQRPSRRAIDATASKDHATGEAATYGDTCKTSTSICISDGGWAESARTEA